MKEFDKNDNLGRALRNSCRGRFPVIGMSDEEIIVQMNKILAEEKCRIRLSEHKSVQIEFDSEEDEICFILKWC